MKLKIIVPSFLAVAAAVLTWFNLDIERNRCGLLWRETMKGNPAEIISSKTPVPLPSAASCSEVPEELAPYREAYLNAETGTPYQVLDYHLSFLNFRAGLTAWMTAGSS